MERGRQEISRLSVTITGDHHLIKILDKVIAGKIVPEEYRKMVGERIDKAKDRIKYLQENLVKIFYPDPVVPDDCAQCGKCRCDHTQSEFSKFIKSEEHQGPFFCN